MWKRYVNEDERPFELKENMKKTTLKKKVKQKLLVP